MRIQRSLCLLVAGLFIFLVSNGCVHQIASKTPNVKPPVPSDVRIIPPVQNIPKELATFSGWWEGEWKGGGYGGKAYLIVEAIYPDKLEVIYCCLKYKGAGHNIGIPYGSTTVTSIRPAVSGSVLALGGNAKDNAFANSDSWPKVLTFLEKSLKR